MRADLMSLVLIGLFRPEEIAFGLKLVPQAKAIVSMTFQDKPIWKYGHQTYEFSEDLFLSDPEVTSEMVAILHSWDQEMEPASDVLHRLAQFVRQAQSQLKHSN